MYIGVLLWHKPDGTWIERATLVTLKSEVRHKFTWLSGKLNEVLISDH
jgi:hypothetical protein